MLLLIPHLYMFTSISDLSDSLYLSYLMFLLASLYLYIPLLSLLLVLMLLSLDSLLNLLAHFHYSLPNHSIRIHSLSYMSHLSLLMNYIYNFMLILLSLLHFMLLTLMLSDSFQTTHCNCYYSPLILVLYYLPLSLSHLALLMFII